MRAGACSGLLCVMLSCAPPHRAPTLRLTLPSPLSVWLHCVLPVLLQGDGPGPWTHVR